MVAKLSSSESYNQSSSVPLKVFVIYVNDDVRVVLKLSSFFAKGEIPIQVLAPTSAPSLKSEISFIVAHLMLSYPSPNLAMKTKHTMANIAVIPAITNNPTIETLTSQFEGGAFLLQHLKGGQHLSNAQQQM